MTPRHTLLAAALAAAFASVHANELQLDQARQPLASSLQQLARQAGITLIVDSSLLAGKQAPALKGQMSWQAALQQLLAGSGSYSLAAIAKGAGFPYAETVGDPAAAEAAIGTFLAQPVLAFLAAGIDQEDSPYPPAPSLSQVEERALFMQRLAATAA